MYRVKAVVLSLIHQSSTVVLYVVLLLPLYVFDTAVVKSAWTICAGSAREKRCKNMH